MTLADDVRAVAELRRAPVAAEFIAACTRLDWDALAAAVDQAEQLISRPVGVIGQNIVVDCGTHEEALRMVGVFDWPEQP